MVANASNTGNDNKETEGPNMEVSVKKAETNNGAENGAKNKPIKKPEKEEVVENATVLSLSRLFNDSLSRARVGKKKGKTQNVLPRGPVYEAIHKKKITKKENIGGNFEIPCSIGGLKYGIAEYILVEIAKHVYLVDFVILDIKEDENKPFILGTPFLTTAKAMIKFDKGTITLRSGKNKWEERIRLYQEKEIEFDRWRSKNFKNEHPALTKVEGEMDDGGEVIFDEKKLGSKSTIGLRTKANPKVWRGLELEGFGSKYTVTLVAHLEKKRTRLRTLQRSTNISKITIAQRLEMASQDTRDAITTHPMTVSQEITTASARMTQPKI
ncbi:reverse transcriptase domain-containing protein [Tanacetum coccineum]